MLRRALAIVSVWSAVALAQPSPDAERLFREGLALFDQGKFAEACARFDQSIAKDPHAIGTLMNLGRCNEKLGKIGTALARFQEAYERAAQANAIGMRDAALERITALTPQVPVVKLRRTGRRLADEKLVVDDLVIAGERDELRLDPGRHTLVLTAPGRLPYHTDFDAAAAHATELELPVLQAPPSGATIRIRPSTRRTSGKTVALLGAGLAVLGGGLALYTKHDYDKLFEDPDGSGPRVASCARDLGCNKDGQARVTRDRNFGTVAGVLCGVGLAAAVTGTVLWLTAPQERAVIVPTASRDGAGIAVGGRF